MEFVERADGIVVPKPPPPPPDKHHGSLEIRCPERREKAREAMGILWHAMGLYDGRGGIRLPGHAYSYEDRYRLYRYFGESILGDDCPEFEQLC